MFTDCKPEMAPDDSDSSDSGSRSYTTTDVLLGYASVEPTSDPFSQLGGYPTWPDPASPPSGTFAHCKSCNGAMALLLQLNGDLPERYPGHERRLYVFSCRRKACRRKPGSLRAVRGTKSSKNALRAIPAKATSVNAPTQDTISQARVPPATNLGSSIFNSNFQSSTSTSPSSNPFASPSSGDPPSIKPHAPNANPFSVSQETGSASTSTPPSQAAALPALFSEKARISPSPTTPSKPTPKTPWPTQEELPPPYPTYHLDADYETLDPTPPSSIKPSDMDIDAPENSSALGFDKETFESTIDKTFQKFADRLAQNPEQVLRYDFTGIPLLYASQDAVDSLLAAALPSDASTSSKVQTTGSKAKGMPACENCGAKRVFELQLVPHLITVLEAEEEGIEGMDWGTVIVGVCGQDCGEKGVEVGAWGWIEEWCGVQWEEISKAV